MNAGVYVFNTAILGIYKNGRQAWNAMFFRDYLDDGIFALRQDGT